MDGDVLVLQRPCAKIDRHALRCLPQGADEILLDEGDRPPIDQEVVSGEKEHVVILRQDERPEADERPLLHVEGPAKELRQLVLRGGLGSPGRTEIAEGDVGHPGRGDDNERVARLVSRVVGAQDVITTSQRLAGRADLCNRERPPHADSETDRVRGRIGLHPGIHPQAGLHRT